MLHTLKPRLSALFQAEVNILPTTLPPGSITHKYGGKLPADSLLAFLSKMKKNKVVEVIGLTRQDIFIPKIHARFSIPEAHSIRGYAYISEGVCIVSNYNLADQNFELEAARLLKAITHEVGHNIGLAHCTSDGCIMTEQSGNIQVLDRISGSFCSKCKNQAN